jgi:catechol 2,3-dioxygenase-like lactoylglutathione lyase family enzyme
MAVDIVGFAHVKLPVTDVGRSARWYASLLGMRLCMEIVEQGQLRGAELVEPASGIKIALRDRSVCAGQPILGGFDVVAVELVSAEAVHAMAEWCADNDVEIIGILDFPGGAAMDVPDPDGTVIRIHHASGRPPFLGVETGAQGETDTYATPRLTGVPVAD